MWWKWKEYRKGIVPNPFSFRWTKDYGDVEIVAASPWDEEWIGTIGIKKYLHPTVVTYEVGLYFIGIWITTYKGG